MKFEKFDWQGLGPSPIIGVDEVGRGCLAGRVYAAAVIFTGDDQFDEYTDSKLLSVERRKILTEKILKKHKVGIGFATAQEIDKINIFQATFVAMKRAIQNLNVNSGHVLVDGKFPIPNLKGFQQTPLIKGDLRAAPISAASIVAKVTRDEYMEEMAKKYNQYGFEKHKGYSTAEHMEQIRVWGPCTEHRKTFRGVKEYVPTAPAGLEI